MTALRIAQAQMPVYTDRKELTEVLKALAEQTVNGSAGFLTLPRCSAVLMTSAVFLLLQKKRAGRSGRYALTSPALSVYISQPATIPERDSDGKIYNTAYIFDRATAGRLQSTGKCTFFDINVKNGQHFQESAVLSPGNDITVL